MFGPILNLNIFLMLRNEGNKTRLTRVLSSLNPHTISIAHRSLRDLAKFNNFRFILTVILLY